MKGEKVAIERDFAGKEVDWELIARNADRRMRYLLESTLARIICTYGSVNLHCYGLAKECMGIKLLILSSCS
jgi:hypothetical protein